MPLLQPADVVDDGDVACLDTPMVAIDGLVAGDGRVAKIIGFLLSHEQIDIVSERSLVALEGKDVIGLFVDDLLGDGPLAAHGVDRDHGAFDGQHVQELRDGDNLVGLVGHLHLTQHHALTGGEGRDHMDRVFCHALGAAQGLAIDSHRPFGDPDQGRHPRHEATLECLGVESGQNITEVVMGWRARREGAKLAQQNKLLVAEAGDVGDRLGPGQDRQKAKQQHFGQGVHHLALLPGIRQITEILKKDN